MEWRDGYRVLVVMALVLAGSGLAARLSAAITFDDILANQPAVGGNDGTWGTRANNGTNQTIAFLNQSFNPDGRLRNITVVGEAVLLTANSSQVFVYGNLTVTGSVIGNLSNATFTSNTVSCSGSDKVTSVIFNQNGSVSITCAADATGGAPDTTPYWRFENSTAFADGYNLTLINQWNESWVRGIASNNTDLTAADDWNFATNESAVLDNRSIIRQGNQSWILTYASSNCSSINSCAHIIYSNNITSYDLSTADDFNYVNNLSFNNTLINQWNETWVRGIVSNNTDLSTADDFNYANNLSFNKTLISQWNESWVRSIASNNTDLTTADDWNFATNESAILDNATIIRTGNLSTIKVGNATWADNASSVPCAGITGADYDICNGDGSGSGAAVLFTYSNVTAYLGVPNQTITRYSDSNLTFRDAFLNFSLIPGAGTSYSTGNGSNRWLNGNWSGAGEFGSITTATGRVTNLQDADGSDFFDYTSAGASATCGQPDQTGAVTCTSIAITTSQVSDYAFVVYTTAENVSNYTSTAFIRDILSFNVSINRSLTAAFQTDLFNGSAVQNRTDWLQKVSNSTWADNASAVNCLDVFGGSDSDYCTDATSTDGAVLMTYANITAYNGVENRSMARYSDGNFSFSGFVNFSLIPGAGTSHRLGNGSGQFLSANISGVGEFGSITAPTIRATNLQKLSGTAWVLSDFSNDLGYIENSDFSISINISNTTISNLGGRASFNDTNFAKIDLDLTNNLTRNSTNIMTEVRAGELAINQTVLKNGSHAFLGQLNITVNQTFIRENLTMRWMNSSGEIRSYTFLNNSGCEITVVGTNRYERC